MDSQFSQRVKDILGYSKEEAIRLGNSHISPEHLFLGILSDGEGVAVEILINQGSIFLYLKDLLKKSIKVESPVPVADHEIIPLLRSTERVLKIVYLEAKALKSSTIDSEHLLLAILKDENALVTRSCRKRMSITSQSGVQWKLLRLSAKLIFHGEEDDDDEPKSSLEEDKGTGQSPVFSKTIFGYSCSGQFRY